MTDEVIATSTWDVPEGITKENENEDATSATIWLSGGEVGEEYHIVNKIITDSTPPRVEEACIVINVTDSC